ncbi:MAG TPA: response regulator transcription factor [Roseiflexaceae bacterium]|nr:response regulator transcription factor [Roseiflexaceae bacterium]
MTTVALIDDQALVRAGLRALLQHDPDISVVGEASDGRAGLALVRRERPQVVLMDIRMPVMDGLTATRLIVGDAELAGTQVVVLTTFDEDEQIEEAIRAGAAGYLLKDITPDDLRRAVHVVAGGEALLSPRITRRVMQRLAVAGGTTNPALVAELTEREREVLRHIGLGESNEELADRLYISPATARTYVSRLLGKLAARDRSQLVVIAYESGLVTPGQP